MKQTRVAQFSVNTFGWLQEEMAPALLRRRIIGAAVLFSLLSAVYWLALASDRYVSEAHVLILTTNLSGGQSNDLASLMNISGSLAEQMVLRDYLLSKDMLRKLDTELDLQSHYSDLKRDILSRMWYRQPTIEWFHRHYLSRVSIELDGSAGAMVIKAQAYDPKMAQAMTAMLVREGEQVMNDMAHSLIQGQVDFLEQQSVLMNEKVMATRQAVLDYQNEKGLVSPKATAENVAGVIAKLEAQRTELETRRSALLTYLVADQYGIVQLDQQIKAIDKQIAKEQAKLASTKGKTLNKSVAEFQRLEMEASFAQDVYKTALVALEKGRFEAIRTIKKVMVIQPPTLPEDSMQPRRFYNTLVYMLVAMLMSGVMHLLVAIVRDHKD